MVPVLQEAKLLTPQSDELQVSLSSPQDVDKDPMYYLASEPVKPITGQYVEMTLPIPVPLPLSKPPFDMLTLSLSGGPYPPDVEKDPMDSLAEEPMVPSTGQNVEVTLLPMSPHLYDGEGSSVPRKIKV